MKYHEVIKSAAREEHEPYYGRGSSYGHNFFTECDGGRANYDWEWVDLHRHGFTRKPIKTWLCTDSMVGYYAIYYEKKFIAVSTQLGRKSDTTFQWVSQEVYDKISAIVRELCDEEEDKYQPEIIDLDATFVF